MISYGDVEIPPKLIEYLLERDVTSEPNHEVFENLRVEDCFPSEQAPYEFKVAISYIANNRNIEDIIRVKELRHL